MGRPPQPHLLLHCHVGEQGHDPCLVARLDQPSIPANGWEASASAENRLRGGQPLSTCSLFRLRSEFRLRHKQPVVHTLGDGLQDANIGHDG
eukprot:scaffold2034_cov124-Isochrysis_galbana.AAC.1